MELKIKKYLPHAMKAALINSIVDICCTEENGIIIYDNMIKELFFNVALVENYTDYHFEVDSNDNYINISEQYDKLVEDGTMEKIIDSIGKDYFILLESLDIAIENKLRQNTVEAVLARGIEKLIQMLDKRLDPKSISKLAKSIEKINPQVAQTVLEVVKNK
jgi:hypothetical protein